MTLFFSEYSSLLELLRSVGYIFLRAGKTFSFNMADLTQFFTEIKKVNILILFWHTCQLKI